MSSQVQAPKIENENELIIIQGNTVKATVPPFVVQFASLGDLINEDGSNYPQVILLGEIIRCESHWKNVCNQRYGCNAGQGIAQLIPSTVKYCEKKLGKPINPFNQEDSLECAMWLLMNEGSFHWGTEFSEWGSWKCWYEFEDK